MAHVGAFLTLLVSACDGSVTSRRETAVYDTLESGRVLVRNTGPSEWASGERWRLVQDLELGQDTAEGPEEFGRIGAVLSDSRGRIHVLDVLSQDVRVFDADGRHLYTTGRSGAGPAELRDAVDLALGPGDTLWVIDPGNARYSAFAPDGRFLRSQPRAVQGYAARGVFMPDGRFMDWGVAFPDEIAGAIVGGRRVLFHPIIVDLASMDQDSLPPLEYNREMMPDGMAPQPFFNNRIVLAVDSGDRAIWFAHNTEYRIYQRQLPADTVLEFSYPAEPALLGDRERDYVVQALAGLPHRVRTFLDALPERKPIIHRIVTDGAGHVFVFADRGTASGLDMVDVFRDTGEYLGSLMLPQTIPLLTRQALVVHATPEYLFVVATDDQEVPYVSRFRIVKPGAAGS